MKPFDWEFPYPSQRMPILARNCVSTSQPLAAQAGAAMEALLSRKVPGKIVLTA